MVFLTLVALPGSPLAAKVFCNNDGACKGKETPESCPNDCGDGGGGGGSTSNAPDPANLVRASFVNIGGSGGGISADGQYTCTIERNGTSVTYDYWDWQERLLSPADSMTEGEPFCDSPENRSNVSGGGRWFLITSAGEVTQDQVVRWLVFDFSDGIDGSECPNLDGGNADLGIDPIYSADGEYPHHSINPDPCVDNLSVRLSADRILKSNANSQQLNMEIYHRPDGSIWWIPWGRITFINSLYLRDPVSEGPFSGRNCRVMSTRPAWDRPHDKQEAEVSMYISPSEELLIGNYNLPLEVCAIRASD
jgi:hypothetical protein